MIIIGLVNCLFKEGMQSDRLTKIVVVTYIMLVLKQLHWLSVRQCIAYKISLSYQSLNFVSGPRVQYLRDMLGLNQLNQRHQHCSNTSVVQLIVPHTKKIMGDRSFAASVPCCGTVCLSAF